MGDGVPAVVGVSGDNVIGFGVSLWQPREPRFRGCRPPNTHTQTFGWGWGKAAVTNSGGS